MADRRTQRVKADLGTGPASPAAAASPSAFAVPPESAVRASGTCGFARNARRQHLVRHLCAAGERPVLKALLAVSGGENLDAVLENFGRITVEIYRALGADTPPIDRLALIEGGAA